MSHTISILYYTCRQNVINKNMALYCFEWKSEWGIEWEISGCFLCGCNTYRIWKNQVWKITCTTDVYLFDLITFQLVNSTLLCIICLKRNLLIRKLSSQKEKISSLTVIFNNYMFLNFMHATSRVRNGCNYPLKIAKRQ